VTTDQLWGVTFLTFGLFSAWRIYRSVNSGRWILTYVGHLSIDRGAHPVAFWAGVACDTFALIILLFLGTQIVAPSILSAH